MKLGLSLNEVGGWPGCPLPLIYVMALWPGLLLEVMRVGVRYSREGEALFGGSVTRTVTALWGL